MNCQIHSSLESLEARIAPASLTLLDVDGDIVTITTSKGTPAQLDAAVTRAAAGGLGGVAISAIDLSSNAAFAGTNLSVFAKRGPLGGDGLVNVSRVDAADDAGDANDTALNLGLVLIDGDLQEFDAGQGTVGSKITSLTMQSTSGAYVWDIAAEVGTLKVKSDLRFSEVNVTGGFGLGALVVGGSILGGGADATGSLEVAGKIGSVKIGRDLQGGMGKDSAQIIAEAIGPITIGGSITGGGGDRSGFLSADEFGAIKIGGDLRGGAGLSSGGLAADMKIGSVTVGGSIVGGAGVQSGLILLVPFNLGEYGTIGAMKVGGSLVGGTAPSSGAIVGVASIASLKIGRDIVGGSATAAGSISLSETLDPASGKLGGTSLSGSLIGGTGAFAGTIGAARSIASLLIGGDVRGGAMPDSGAILTKSFVSSANEGTLGAITIKGSLIGLSADKPVQIIAGGADGAGPKPDLALKSLTVGGRIEFARILAGYDFMGVMNADAQVGAIKVAGDWIGSIVAAGVEDGADNLFATADDVPTNKSDTAGLFSKIASITIGGQVRSTLGVNDHFGFVAQEIGSFSVAGTKFALNAGRANDNLSATDSKYQVGVNGDATVREV